MDLDLVLDIDDPIIRENFFRLMRYVQAQSILRGNFSFFEIEIPAATSKFTLKHSLGFIPLDVIVLSVHGNFNFYFRHQEFDRNNLYVTAAGPVKIRFLAGLYSEPGYEKKPVEYPLVAPT
jgi:hypothetical protein